MVEILVGLGLFAILGVGVAVMLFATLRGARKTTAINVANNEGRHALNLMAQMTRFAKVAQCPSPTSLTLTKTDDTTMSYSLSGTAIASGSANLTSQRVTVTACSGTMFTCSGRTVQICFNIDAAGAADVTETAEGVGTGIKFVTTVTLRNYGI
ncbi:MAG: hypothetical protein G01um101416_452 [Microgenomates group bacterium Gr01-1014_16]|nr:MAG: hypothetical protein G01um101416_452 [Microgenomates group bacterium Gr01-1014_16]